MAGNWLTNAFNRLRGRPTITRKGGHFGTTGEMTSNERELQGYHRQMNRDGWLPRNASQVPTSSNYQQIRPNDTSSTGQIPLQAGLVPLSGGSNPFYDNMPRGDTYDRGSRINAMYGPRRAPQTQTYYNNQATDPRRIGGGSYNDMRLGPGGPTRQDFQPEPRLQANQPEGLWGRFKNWWNGVNPNDRSSYQQSNDEKMYIDAMRAYNNQQEDQGGQTPAGGYTIPDQYMGSTGQPAPQASPWGSGYPIGYQAEGMGEEMQPTLPSNPAPQIPQQDMNRDTDNRMGGS
jgi:hypothetical protein